MTTYHTPLPAPGTYVVCEINGTQHSIYTGSRIVGCPGDAILVQPEALAPSPMPILYRPGGKSEPYPQFMRTVED